ncbi:MAG: methyltransferase domain-containing protein [Methanosarcinales archaeon]|nr:methyltransferase domain-containing protein [Methanosarcinales archaeon]
MEQNNNEINQEKSVQNYFSNYANIYYKENYDDDSKNCYSYSHIIRKNHIIRMFDKDGGKVLDIGCGPGVITLHLLMKECEVWGVDISEEMINEASRFVEGTKFNNMAHFSVGDIKALDFPNNYFDAVICSGVLEYLDNEELAITEINRVLKQNGTAIIAVPTPHRLYTFSLKLFKRIFKSFIPLAIKLKRKRIDREYRGNNSIRNFNQKTYSPTKLNELLLNNKFEKKDYAYYHFISYFISLFAPSISLYFGEKLDSMLFREKIFGRLSKGYIVKVKKL